MSADILALDLWTAFMLVGLAGLVLRPFGRFGIIPRHWLRRYRPVHASRIQVIDGDSITIINGQGKRIKCRIAGYDAPEYDQPYGKNATRALATMIKQARNIRVAITGADYYYRPLVHLDLDGQDVARLMIAGGHARTTRDATFAMIRDSWKARLAARGLWRERSIHPRRWRQMR